MNLKTETNRFPRLVLGLTVASIVVLLVWASVGKIEQVTRAPAHITTDAKNQGIQSADGGIIKEILIQEGDQVEKDQVLFRLVDARVSSMYADTNSKLMAIEIYVSRLKSELMNSPFKFEPRWKGYENYFQNQKILKEKRATSFSSEVEGMKKTRELIVQELSMVEKLSSMGDIPKSELFRLQRQLNEQDTAIAARANKFFQDTQAELAKAEEELRTQTESYKDKAQLLTQSTIRATANGIVKNLLVSNIGTVVRPGEILAEILPNQSDLIVEAKVSPSDIPYVKNGMVAKVSLDAFDSSIFGYLTGEVEYISPDTLSEESRQGKLVFYKVLIRLTHIPNEKKIDLRPGLTGSVNIVAGNRSVISYILKPLSKTFKQSLGER